MVVHAIGRSV
jgi:hypothetical protein